MTVCREPVGRVSTHRYRDREGTEHGPEHRPEQKQKKKQNLDLRQPKKLAGVIRVAWLRKEAEPRASVGALPSRFADLHQPALACFRSRLPVSYAVAKRDGYSDPATLIEHCLRFLQGTFGSPRTLSGERHFQNDKFHYPAVRGFTVPSKRKPVRAGIVPGAVICPVGATVSVAEHWATGARVCTRPKSLGLNQSKSALRP